MKGFFQGFRVLAFLAAWGTTIVGKTASGIPSSSFCEPTATHPRTLL